jgi:prepilin-type N-terminal cleavage/methylation domain-containing protein
MKISPILRSQISKFAGKIAGRAFRKLKGKTTGFTLIELLVVIAIIAVLAGMLFPAMQGVRNAARKTSAKNDVVQIVTAVKNYYTEYGKYPVPAGTSGDLAISGTANSNNSVIEVLTTGSSTTLNPRAIRFLEVAEAKDQNAPKSGLKSKKWYDPWGGTYFIFIDSSYDGKVTITGLKPTSENVEIETGVAAASYGNPDRTSGDPVMSWK